MSQDLKIVDGYGLKVNELVDSENIIKLKSLSVDFISLLISGKLFDYVDEYNETLEDGIHVSWANIDDDEGFNGNGWYIYVPKIQPYNKKAVHSMEELKDAIINALGFALCRSIIELGSDKKLLNDFTDKDIPILEGIEKSLKHVFDGNPNLFSDVFAVSFS